MKRQSRLELALREWRALEKQCASSAKTGAFLVDDDGELLLHQNRPCVGFVFGRAWQARREVERLAAEAGVEPPLPGVSSAYTEWPAVDALVQFFLVTGDMNWAEIRDSYFDHFEDFVKPRSTTPIT